MGLRVQGSNFSGQGSGLKAEVAFCRLLEGFWVQLCGIQIEALIKGSWVVPLRS